MMNRMRYAPCPAASAAGLRQPWPTSLDAQRRSPDRDHEEIMDEQIRIKPAYSQAMTVQRQAIKRWCLDKQGEAQAPDQDGDPPAGLTTPMPGC